MSSSVPIHNLFFPQIDHLSAYQSLVKWGSPTLREPLHLVRPTLCYGEDSGRGTENAWASDLSPCLLFTLYQLCKPGQICSASLNFFLYKMRVIIIADGFVEGIQDYTLVKSLAACLAHRRCSLNPGFCYNGDQCRGMEDTARGSPECPPRGKGWRREAELEAIPGEGREDDRAQRCPHWIRRRRAQLWCLSAASSSYDSCAHLTVSPPRASVWVGHPHHHYHYCRTVSCCFLPHLPSWPR